MKTSSLKLSGLEKIYDLLNILSQKSRIPLLIKLKITIGLALISYKTAKSQTVEFPNNVNKSDTLKLNVELENDPITLCYEVVVINYKKKEPQYIGGQRALNKFVKEHVNYPENALTSKIEGDVAVNITIDDEGKITQSEVIRKKGYGLDEEALRLVQMLPNLKPGKLNGRKSTMNKTIVIHFELPHK